MIPVPKAIVFDWDNTLVDSWEGIREAYNATFRHFGMPLWSLEDTQANVAGSMRDTFPQMFGERWEEARDVFYATVTAIGTRYLNPLDGALPLLQWLQSQNIHAAVVSNKNGVLLRRDVSALGWDPLFCGVVGAGDCPRDKPAIDPVLSALQTTDIPLNPDVWFVGDSHVDIRCGQNAGCRTVLLHPSPPTMEEDLNPDDHHPDCHSLLGFLQKLPIPCSTL